VDFIIKTAKDAYSLAKKFGIDLRFHHEMIALSMGTLKGDYCVL